LNETTESHGALTTRSALAAVWGRYGFTLTAAVGLPLVAALSFGVALTARRAAANRESVQWGRTYARLTGAAGARSRAVSTATVKVLRTAGLTVSPAPGETVYVVARLRWGRSARRSSDSLADARAQMSYDVLGRARSGDLVSVGQNGVVRVTD
jgi:hypothetical protein